MNLECRCVATKTSISLQPFHEPNCPMSQQESSVTVSETPAPDITLKQWLRVDQRRRAVIRAEDDEVRVLLLGESLTWRGYGDNETQAIDGALAARKKLHGRAL